MQRVWSTSLLVCLTSALSTTSSAQIIHGTVSSAVAAGRVSGAVVLLLDSSLTTRARALTGDSGTFVIGAGVAGHFRIKVMRIGFRPAASPIFELTRDTSIDLALTDIPVILPTVTTRDRSECRIHPDTADASVTTFALWEQAKTALLATAITLERHDYRFAKLQHTRIYDLKHGELRDIRLTELVTHGSAPWTSLPAERLRRDGYVAEDDSGMTFFAPDIDVLLSPYFSETHCFHLNAGAPPSPAFVGLAFEPAGRPRHVEIRGILWVDSASKELRSMSFNYVNLPTIASDTVVGGRVDFERLSTGAWILPSWSIRMPTPYRGGSVQIPFGRHGTDVLNIAGGRGRWRLTTDWIRVSGGDLRAVRSGEERDSVLWQRPAGAVRVAVMSPPEAGGTLVPGADVRLTGSSYGGFTGADGTVLFKGLLPGSYLFEASTALEGALESTPARARVDAASDSVAQLRITLRPLAQAAAEACHADKLRAGTGVVVGHVFRDDQPAAGARVEVDRGHDNASIDTRGDGYFRVCGLPLGQPLLIRATSKAFQATTTVTLANEEIVKVVQLTLQP